MPCCKGAFKRQLAGVSRSTVGAGGRPDKFWRASFHFDPRPSRQARIVGAFSLAETRRGSKFRDGSLFRCTPPPFKFHSRLPVRAPCTCGPSPHSQRRETHAEFFFRLGHPDHFKRD